MRTAISLGLAALAVASCADDRPSDEEWAATWLDEQAALPDADTLLAGGQPMCDELVGELRSSLDRLTPTPTEALDDAVRAWVDHAHTIVFECPEDPDDLAARLAELDVLAAEIDAGFAADAS